jgi:ferric-dicitrate binding protein FerR (iron transport regulator)
MNEKRRNEDLNSMFGQLDEPMPSDQQIDRTAAQVLNRLRTEYAIDPRVASDFSRVSIPRRSRMGLAATVAIVVIAVGALPIFMPRVSTQSEVYAVPQTIDGTLYRLAGAETRPVGRNERIGKGQALLATGGGAILALNDGSRVEMRTESLLLLERSSGGIRINLRMGSVIVTAADQSSGHLYLRTRDYGVSVTGTVFGVNTGMRGSKVFVIEGEVLVEQGPKSETLRGGQQIATDPMLATLPVEEDIQWSRNARGHLALLQLTSTAPRREDSPLKGSIEGTVVRSGSNDPIANAQVSLVVALVHGQQFHSAIGPDGTLPGVSARTSTLTIPPVETDERGRFVIRDVEPGSYRLVAARNGFVRQEYGQSADRRPGSVVTVAPGQSLKDLDFKLVSTGTVSGRVTDTRGEPLANMNVGLFRAAYDRNGHRTFLAAIPSVRTNDLGEYRFFWVSPGRYFVRADGSRSSREMALRSPASGIILADAARMGAEFNSNEVVHPAYTPAYYPGGATTPAEAQPIEIRSGEQVTGIDLRIGTQKLFRVRGRLIDATTGQPSRLGGVDLSPWDSTFDGGDKFSTFTDRTISTSSYDPATGAFEIRDVPPGVYEASVAMLPPDPTTSPSRYLKTRVEVVNRDVENLVLIAGPIVTVQGRVVLDGLATSEVSGFGRTGVVLSSPSQPSNATTVKSDGSFAIRIPSGEYALSVGQLPPNLYVRSARLGQTDVLNQPVRVGLSFTDSIEIVLAPGGQIAGTLVDRNAAPAQSTAVILVPQERGRRDLYKSTGTDLNGQFVFQGIAPGNYTLFAWEDIEPFSYFDPDVLRAYDALGQAVRVTESGRPTVTLRIIPSGR